MKTKKWITYTIYGILITAVFLYLRFPSDSVEKHIRSIVARNNSDVVVSFDSVRPCFPPGIRLHMLSVDFKNKPGLTFKADVAKIRPVLLNLLSGKLKVLLNADAYEGHIKTDIGFTNRFSSKGPVMIKTEFKDINLEKCSFIKAVTDRRVNGRLSGSLLYDGKYDRFISSAGSAELTIIDGNIELLKNMFGFDALAFDKAEAELTLKDRTIKINGLDITGKQLSGSFTGDLFLDREIMQTRLAIKGNIKIPALDRKFSTTLKGTVAKPIPGFR